jgi:hypothetical protein
VSADLAIGDGQWGKVPRALAGDENLSCGALRAFIVLSSYADGASRIAQASQARLATDLGIGRRSVQRLLDELALCGWITVSRPFRKRGGYGVNAYLVAPFPLVRADAPEQARATRIEAEVHNSDARESSLAPGIAMPGPQHAVAHVDAQKQARGRALSDLLSQTSSVSDPLLAQRSKASVERDVDPGSEQAPNRDEEEQTRKRQILELHRHLDDDRTVKAERNMWVILVDRKGYTRAEAFLLLARGLVAGERPSAVYEAAVPAGQWRKDNPEFADAA